MRSATAHLRQPGLPAQALVMRLSDRLRPNGATVASLLVLAAAVLAPTAAAGGRPRALRLLQASDGGAIRTVRTQQQFRAALADSEVTGIQVRGHVLLANVLLHSAVANPTALRPSMNTATLQTVEACRERSHVTILLSLHH